MTLIPEGLRLENIPHLNKKIDVTEVLHYCRDKREIAKVVKCSGMVDFIKLKDSGEHGQETLKLYENLFPDLDERIPWERLSHAIDMHSEHDIAPLLLMGYNSKVRGLLALKENHVTGLAFFKTLPSEDDFMAVLMYIGVADKRYMKDEYGLHEDMRGLGIANAFHAIIRRMCVKDSAKSGYEGKSLGVLADSEFIGAAKDEERIKYTQTRLKIHGSMGMFPVLLDCGSGALINPTLQPCLVPGLNPLIMHMMLRPYDIRLPKPPCELDLGVMRKLVEAYGKSYDSVDSDDGSILEVKQEMGKRLASAKRALVLRPPDVPDICRLARDDPLLRAQVERDFGDLDEHQALIKRALG